MPIYRIDAAELPRPPTLRAKSLSQAAGYADEKGWRVRSITFVSERGPADSKVDIALRDSYKPKSLTTRIELTIDQIVVGVLLTIACFMLVRGLFWIFA